MKRFFPKEKTAPLRVARVLENSEAPLSIEEIAEKADSSEETVQRTVQYLQNKKLVVKKEMNGEIKFQKDYTPDFT